MNIQYHIDYETLREEIKLIYTENDTCRMKSKIQDLLPDHKCTKEGIPDIIDSEYSRCIKIEGNLFNSFCDLMSIDFKLLETELYNLIERSNCSNDDKQYQLLECNIFNFLSSKSSLLADCADIHDLLKNRGTTPVLFTELKSIRKYVEKYIEDKYFQNPDVFIMFINNVFTGQPIPQKSFDIKFYERAFKANDLENNAEQDKFNFVDFSTDYFFNNVKKYPAEKRPHFERCQDKIDICVASLFEICLNNYPIKRCENCGKYFIPYSRSDAIYCDRISPENRNKTCKESAKYKKQLERERSNEAGKVYKSIYTMKLNKS